MVFSGLRKSFRDRMGGRYPIQEESPASYQEPALSKSRQNVAEESRPTRRASATAPKSQWGGTSRVVKRKSSRNLSRNRVDWIAAAAESQEARPKLQTVEESGLQAIKQGRSSFASMHSPKTSRDRVSPNPLVEMSVPELVQTLMDLRQENEALKTRSLTGVEHSNKDISARDSTQWNKQKQALDEAREQLAKANEELKSQKTKVKEAERSKNRMLKQLALATKIEASFYDDSHFKEQIQQLRWDVYNWVKDRRWEVASRGRNRHGQIMVPKAYSFLRTTCPDYHDYVGSKRGVELLIQAHIWQYFGREVFNSRCFWAETRAKSQAERDSNDNPFSLLRTHLRDEIAHRHRRELEFQEWRVASVRLLALRDPKLVEANIALAGQKIVLSLGEDFKPIMNGNMHLHSLENIFRSAIHLDYLIQQQRPDYLIYPVLRYTTKLELQYDEERMNAPDDDEQVAHSKLPLNVKLVVEPGFCKFGDSAGKNYDVQTCLLKAEVKF